MFGYLVHRYAEAVKAEEVGPNGSFYLPRVQRFVDAPLEMDYQDKAIQDLQRRGYLRLKLKPKTNKQYFKLYVDKLLRDIPTT